jgi:hypothetical protein
MTDYKDPWAEEQPEEEQAASAPEAPENTPSVSAGDSTRISTTFKQHPGFDAPWIVFEAGTVEGVKNLLRDALKGDFTKAVAHTAAEFIKTAPGDAGQKPSGRQQRPNTPPGVEVKKCNHGERVYRTGNGNYGPYKAWYCPLEKNDPDKCKAIYENGK